jgi:hypothetical protein
MCVCRRIKNPQLYLLSHVIPVADVARKSLRFVSDEGDNHRVQIEEEHDEVETELDEGFLQADSH